MKTVKKLWCLFMGHKWAVRMWAGDPVHRCERCGVLRSGSIGEVVAR